MIQLPLCEFHKNAGANFKDIQGHSVPADYGSVEGELEALDKRVALLDRSYLGKINVSGSDALDLLNRISTNDLQYLAAANVTDTVFVTPKGRLIDYCRILNTREGLVLIGSFFRAEHLINWINRFIILEDVELKDISLDYIWLTLIGPYANRFISDLAGRPVGEAEESIWLNIIDENVLAVRNNNLRLPAYNLCFPTERSSDVMESLHQELQTLSGRMIGDTAFQIIRVESGMPDWGTEITQDYNPHEARLTNAISFTKGCYTGQEVIARLDTYEKVQKYLMIIELTRPISGQPPLDLFIEDENIGQMTSFVYDPVYKRNVGLGYVKKMYAAEDNIYVEIQQESGRLPGRLRLPPQAYRDK